MLMGVLEMFPVFALTQNAQFRSFSRLDTYIKGQVCLGFLINLHDKHYNE